MSLREEDIERYFYDRRPIAARPGTYWARPAAALTSSSQLKAGMEVWHAYLWAADYPVERIAIQRIGTLDEVAGRNPAPGLLGGVWFEGSGGRHHSCHDCSLDGADGNNNYIFASEQGALDAIANRVPRQRAA